MSSPLKRRLSIFLLLVLLIAGGFFLHWLLEGRFIQSTDNAYVQGDITRVASQLGARIESVAVRDNQRVARGDLLVTLEAEDFRLALERAQASLATREAELAQARSRAAQQSSLIQASEAEVASAQASLARVRLDLKRATTLRKPGYVSEERVTSLAADEHVAVSQLNKAAADLRAQRQQVHTLEAEIASLEAQLQTARSDIAQAELNLARTRILAPGAGLVGQRTARAGQVVEPGTHLLALVPEQDLWVQANFKETQIGKMRPGQSAELVFDSFPDMPIEARVDSLFAASGAQFSLLPPDNATGNFTKVVQRIPVRLSIPADNPLAGLIRPGMSVLVKVDLRTGE